MFRHVVMFRFADDVTDEQKEADAGRITAAARGHPRDPWPTASATTPACGMTTSTSASRPTSMTRTVSSPTGTTRPPEGHRRSDRAHHHRPGGGAVRVADGPAARPPRVTGQRARMRRIAFARPHPGGRSLIAMAAEGGDRWVARPFIAGLIRVLVVLVPAVAGALASWQVSRVWEQPSEFWAVSAGSSRWWRWRWPSFSWSSASPGGSCRWPGCSPSRWPSPTRPRPGW